MLGPVQVVPPQGLTALRGLHLDRTCAPAVTWQLTKRAPEQDQLKSECPRFQGNPEPAIYSLAEYLERPAIGDHLSRLVVGRVSQR